MSQLPSRERNRLAKEKRILDAALIVFSQLGFSGASMDAIASEANVSKATLYQYFGDKKQLFAAMLIPQGDLMIDAVQQSSDKDMVAQLHRFSWHYATFVLRPDMLSLARLIMAEVQRFPEIGPAYQASGPDRLLSALMQELESYRSQNRLAFHDSELAAQDFWGLILSAPRNKALHEPNKTLKKAELKRYIDNGLTVFLKAYSTQPDKDIATLTLL